MDGVDGWSREAGSVYDLGGAHVTVYTIEGLADSVWNHSIDDINRTCLENFRRHWKCLDDNNHQLWQCRPEEWRLNKCVLEELVGIPSPQLLLRALPD